MPTFQSTQRTAQVAAATSFASRLDDSRQVSGELQYALIDVTVAASWAANDIVELVELPAGAIIYPELSRIIVTDDMSSGAVTIDIGDIVDPDRYCDGANCAAVGTVEFLAPAIPAAYTTRHPVLETGNASTATNLILLTFASLGATVEAGQFRVILAYKTL